MLRERLFVYGTLHRGRAPAALRSVVEGWHWLGEAWVAGRLYDFGAYPGAVLHATGAQRIFGELSELPEDPGMWSLLDRYEAFDPQRPETSLFRRVRCRAHLSSDACDAWIYVCGQEPGPERLIAGGRWTPPDRVRGLSSGRRSR